jgi:hypothetical protein
MVYFVIHHYSELHIMCVITFFYIFRLFIINISILIFSNGQKIYSHHKSEPHNQRWQEQFLQEASPNWEKYSILIQQLQGIYTYNGYFILIDSSKHRETKLYEKHILKMNKDCKMINISMDQDIIDKKTNKQEKIKYNYIYAYNSSYLFSLRDSKLSSLVLTDIIFPRENEIPENYQRQFQLFHNLDVLKLDREPLSELCRHPQFRIVSYKVLQDENKNLIEIDFECPHPKDKRSSGLQGGIMVLDPQNHWIICRSQIRIEGFDYKGIIKFEVLEFAQSENGLAYAKRVRKVGEFPGNDGSLSKYEILIDADLKFLSGRQLPSDEEFTLSAFGLPEPLGVQRPTRWWLWTSIAGVLLIVVGAVCFRLSQRRRHA